MNDVEQFFDVYPAAHELCTVTKSLSEYFQKARDDEDYDNDTREWLSVHKTSLSDEFQLLENTLNVEVWKNHAHDWKHWVLRVLGVWSTAKTMDDVDDLSDALRCASLAAERFRRSLSLSNFGPWGTHFLACILDENGTVKGPFESIKSKFDAIRSRTIGRDAPPEILDLADSQRAWQVVVDDYDFTVTKGVSAFVNLGDTKQFWLLKVLTEAEGVYLDLDEIVRRLPGHHKTNERNIAAIKSRLCKQLRQHQLGDVADAILAQTWRYGFFMRGSTR